MTERHEFDFPRVHITRQFEEDGEMFDEAVTSPVCDFCYDTRVRWDYGCETFSIPEIKFGSHNGWAACDACSDLIERAMLPMLTRRMLASWQALGRKIDEDDIDNAAKIIDGFLQHRIGERQAFG